MPKFPHSPPKLTASWQKAWQPSPQRQAAATPSLVGRELAKEGKEPLLASEGVGIWFLNWACEELKRIHAAHGAVNSHHLHDAFDNRVEELPIGNRRS